MSSWLLALLASSQIPYELLALVLIFPDCFLLVFSNNFIIRTFRLYCLLFFIAYIFFFRLLLDFFLPLKKGIKTSDFRPNGPFCDFLGRFNRLIPRDMKNKKGMQTTK